MLQVVPLAYSKDSVALFQTIAHLPGVVWLDSGRPASDMGRYDILSALPDTLLTPDLKPAELSPFEFIQHAAGQLPHVENDDLPFTIGLLGYFSYETERSAATASAFSANSRLSAKPKLAENPEFIWGIYKHSIVVDHHTQQTFFCYWQDGTNTSALRLLDLITHKKTERQKSSGFSIGEMTSIVDWESYRHNFKLIKNNILMGNTYQVNYTNPHWCEYSGDCSLAYQYLRNHLPSPYSGFLSFGETHILSFSPEQFIEKFGNKVITKPIKGTRQRKADPLEDAKQQQALMASIKDRAENLMIVDLLRNDLGKVATAGSVRADLLFELQSFANVHHLVSTVSCTTDENTQAMSVLESAWPGGSITGAPKKRAMSVIDQVEPYQRGVYCGSIGYLTPGGNLNTNLCIRTIVADQHKLVCWAGGGIVADSEVQSEYEEALGKIETLLSGLSAFQTINRKAFD